MRSPSASVDVRQDLPFHRPPERDLRLDAYLPRHDDAAPVFVWAHGGKYVEGAKGGDDSRLLPGLAARGVACVDVEYRLAGDAPFPAAVHDLRAALRWVRARAGDYGFDSDRVVAGGVSAGAHLAAFASVTPGRDEYEPSDGRDGLSARMDGVVGVSGIYDVAGYCERVRAGGGSLDPSFEAFLGEPYAAAPALYREASPPKHATGDAPPTLLLHGTADEMLPFAGARRYRDTLVDCSVRTRLVGAVGGPHWFYRLDPWRERAVDEIHQFVRLV